MTVAAAAKGAAIRDVEGDVDAEEELEGNVERGDAVPKEEGWNGRWEGATDSLLALKALNSFMGRGRMGRDIRSAKRDDNYGASNIIQPCPGS
jgi:hypothetical protein